MIKHTPTPWMTQPCGELLPDDVMIVADMGKTPNGIQSISTVARALSIRQTKETTAANAAFIVRAVNNHDALVETAQNLIDEINTRGTHERWKGLARILWALEADAIASVVGSPTGER